MDLRTLKQVYCIGPEHIPAGSVVVEISGWDSEDVTFKEGGRQVSKTRHLLYFKGWPLPLRLNNTRLDALMATTGVTDTEELKGKKIKLVVTNAVKYGETVLDIMIHHAPVGANIPAESYINPFTANANRRLPPAGDTPMPANGQLRDTRPIGQKVAAKVLEGFTKNKTDLDGLLRFAKVNDYDLWEAVYGKPIEDFPVWALASIGQCLKAMQLPTELAGSAPDALKQAPVEEIDVPF